MITNHMTPERVAEVMDVDVGRMAPIAWLLIQEEARGVSREAIAKALEVTLSDLQDLQDSVTGQEGDESNTTWRMGIVALKTASMLTQDTLATGWDSMEAMAVKKLNQSLDAMKNSGDPEMMLKIATAANKAIRRDKGEGGSGRSAALSRPGELAGSSQGGVSLTLQSGNLGSIRLNLSPRIQEQLAAPNRQIDVTPNQPEGSKLALEMLRLNETRELISDGKDDSSALDSKFDFSAVLNMGFDNGSSE